MTRENLGGYDGKLVVDIVAGKYYFHNYRYGMEMYVAPADIREVLEYPSRKRWGSGRSYSNDLYISLMQNLCDDEFVTTIGNSGFYELDNNLIVSTFLYRENKSPWKDKEVILLNITCALPIEEQDVFSERLKKNIEEWRGDAICTFQLGKTNTYFELDIRIPLDITEQKSLSLLYKRLIFFLLFIVYCRVVEHRCADAEFTILSH